MTKLAPATPSVLCHAGRPEDPSPGQRWVGRWSAQQVGGAASPPTQMTLDLRANGTVEVVRQLAAFQVPAHGTWSYSQATGSLEMDLHKRLV